MLTSGRFSPARPAFPGSATGGRRALEARRPAGGELYDILAGQCSQALGFIDRLLELSKAGRSGDERSPVALDRLAREILDLARSPELSAELRITGPFPAVRADEFRMRELLQNLISNALACHEPAKERLSLSFTHEPREGHHLFILADNGTGIDAESLEKIFKIGYSTKKEKRRCSGFGLAIARTIVEAHEGRLWAESEGSGKGAKLCFTLPAPQGGLGEKSCSAGLFTSRGRRENRWPSGSSRMALLRNL